jgi:hypothetical protein
MLYVSLSTIVEPDLVWYYYSHVSPAYRSAALCVSCPSPHRLALVASLDLVIGYGMIEMGRNCRWWSRVLLYIRRRASLSGTWGVYIDHLLGRIETLGQRSILKIAIYLPPSKTVPATSSFEPIFVWGSTWNHQFCYPQPSILQPAFFKIDGWPKISNEEGGYNLYGWLPSCLAEEYSLLEKWSVWTS